MRIAIVSSIDYVNKISEDIWLASALKKADFNADIVAWDDPSIDWGQYDVAILRSAWNYHKKYKSFLQWLDLLDSKAVRLINNTKMVRWNIRKDIQLNALNELGLPIIPYVMSTATGFMSVDYYERLNSDKLVIKPLVSASGHDTYLLDKNSPIMEKVSKIFQNKKFIVQPFVESIGEGEYALIFLGGVFSHATIRYPGVISEKRPTRYVENHNTPKDIINLAGRCSDCMKGYFGCYPVYARYDIVDNHIMEVELAEPDLMTRNIPEENRQKALARLVDLIKQEVR